MHGQPLAIKNVSCFDRDKALNKKGWPALSPALQIRAEALLLRCGTTLRSDEAEHFYAKSIRQRPLAPTAVRLHRKTVRFPVEITVHLHRNPRHVASEEHSQAHRAAAEIPPTFSNACENFPNCVKARQITYVACFVDDTVPAFNDRPSGTRLPASFGYEDFVALGQLWALLRAAKSRWQPMPACRTDWNSGWLRILSKNGSESSAG